MYAKNIKTETAQNNNKANEAGNTQIEIGNTRIDTGNTNTETQNEKQHRNLKHNFRKLKHRFRKWKRVEPGKFKKHSNKQKTYYIYLWVVPYRPLKKNPFINASTPPADSSL